MASGGIARVVALVGVAILAAGCGPRPASPAAEAEPVAAPWSAPEVAPAAVPAVHLTAWRAAPNRATCALLAPVATGVEASATARIATFGGGWGVAYDLPGQRSAFGVAGTGVLAAGDDVYDSWPHRVHWSDGSDAGYGPEGGTGPNQLAYLRVAGQTCLYNVWSRIGVEHLERLLGALRLVRTTS